MNTGSYWIRWLIVAAAIVVLAPLAHVLQHVFTGLDAPWELLITVIVARFLVDVFAHELFHGGINYFLLLGAHSILTVLGAALLTGPFGPIAGPIVSVLAVPLIVDLIAKAVTSNGTQAHAPATRRP